MTEIRYERNGIQLIIIDEIVTVKKNGLTISLPFSFIEEFFWELDKEKQEILKDLRKNLREY